MKMNKKANSHFEFSFNRKLLNSKRSQAQIITTVLIILLVLAAIVIVWQVVRQTVETGAGEIIGGTDCITIGLELVDVTLPTTSPFDNKFKVKRKSGAGDLGKIVVIIDGSVQTTEIDASTLGELGTTAEQPYTTTTAASKIEIAAKLSPDSNSKLCGIADTYSLA